MQAQMALFLGLVLLGGGQPEQDSSPSDKPGPVAQQPQEAPVAEQASCCGKCRKHGRHCRKRRCAKSGCCDPCGGDCGHESVCCWMIREMCLGPLFHGDCNMVPHSAYFPELHGYYYFRPYHFSHIRMHQEFVSSFGEDPRAPYANTVFQQVYRQMESKPSSSHRLRVLPHASKPQAKPRQTAVRPVAWQGTSPAKEKQAPVLSRNK